MTKDNVILIVSRDDTYAGRLKGILSRFDFLITRATAFDRLKEAGPTITPNLILIDEDYELLKDRGGISRIRKYFSDPAIKVAFLVEEKSIEEIDRMVLEGADDVILKSSPDYLIAGKVQMLLRNFQQVRDLVEEKSRLSSSNAAQRSFVKKLQEHSKRLEALSYRDGLTKLFNQRFLSMKLHSEFERALRHRRSLSCLLVDLDFFKAVNYTYGHQAGDAVLKEVASILTGAARSIDLVFRKGGDEFVVLLPDTPLDGAMHVASRIHSAIGRHSFLKDSHNVKMTASVGLSSFRRGLFSSSKELFEAADEATREAKKTGGDRIVCWKDEQAQASAAEDSLMEMPSKSLDEFASKYFIMQRDVKEEFLLSMQSWLKSFNRSELLLAHHDHAASIALKLGRRFEMKGNDLETLRFAALFFDMGKVSVWNDIILKPAKISPEEYALVKRHPIMAVNFLSRAPFFGQEIPIILHHHERWDGAGYPDGLEAENIPLGSRILSVADAFDAMTSESPYSPTRSVEDATEELARCAGSQFDENVVGVFLGLIKDGELAEKS